MATIEKPHQESITTAWLGGVQAGGVHPIPVYLWTGEGLSERNLALLHRVKLLTNALKGLWIIGGDWNTDPETLQASG